MKIQVYPREDLGTKPIKIKYSEYSCGILISAVTVEEKRIWVDDLEKMGFDETILRDSPRWDISRKRWIPWR